VRDVDYVTGCAMLVKREVIERIGALDERFFAYYEETEWCARARRAGFRVAHVPPVRMWHKIEPAARGNSPLYLYLMARNRLLYLKCSGAGRRRILLASVDLLRTAASSLRRREKRATIRCSGPLVHGVCDFLLGRLGVPPAYP
jgi:GT2 family glycosyltransferase